MLRDHADATAVVEDGRVDVGADPALDAAELVCREILGLFAGHRDIGLVDGCIFSGIRVELGAVASCARRLTVHREREYPRDPQMPRFSPRSARPRRKTSSLNVAEA